MRKRIIPCLLISERMLVKTRKFKNPIYIGDPLNAARIFSEKEVDELVILDIDASKKGGEPDYEFIAEISGECFMPVSYGGGVKTIEQVSRLIRSGIEKVVINSAAIESMELISECSQRFGSQAIIGGVDVKKTILGRYKVVANSDTLATNLDPFEQINRMVHSGAGEILLSSVDRDGVMQGYDIELIRAVSTSVSVPIIACGGAGDLSHVVDVFKLAGASAAAAGSLFIFQGKHKAVLLSYPDMDSFTLL